MFARCSMSGSNRIHRVRSFRICHQRHNSPASPLSPQVTDDYSVIGRNLFKKETNLQLFVGLKVTLSTGESGVIEGGFGQSGKFKIRVPGKDTPRLLYTCSQSPKCWMESLSPQSF